jgi:UDP-glucose 4-epimerase
VPLWASAPKVRSSRFGFKAMLATVSLFVGMLEHRIDAVIHSVGSVVVTESVRDPPPVLSKQHLPFAVADCLRRRGRSAVLIFSSTAAVYGTPASNPVGEYTEARPTSPYGSSKLMTEIMLLDSAFAYGLHYVALPISMSPAQIRPVAADDRQRMRHI